MGYNIGKEKGGRDMRKEEWISRLKSIENSGASLGQVPLGWDGAGEVVFSHRKNRRDRYCHTCATGALRTPFLMDTVLSLAAAYGFAGARFLVLSPKREYANLLTAKGADIIVPYLQTESQFEKLKTLAYAEADARKKNPNLPRLFVVVDGWEKLPFLPRDNAFTYLREVIAYLSGGAEIFTAIDFKDSIFEGFEGAFIGVGNSLVSVDENGKADVVHVGEDCGLDVPVSIAYTTHFEAN